MKMYLFLGAVFLAIYSVLGDEQAPFVVDPIAPHDILCPLPSCLPVGPCSEPLETSFITVNGGRCEMCQFCPDNRGDGQEPIQVDPIVVHDPCPIPSCLDPGPCPEPLETSFITVNGRRCELCQFCPNNSGDGQEPIQVDPIVVHDPCPIPRCADAGPCPVPKEISVVEVNGRRCPMCPYCPDSGE